MAEVALPADVVTLGPLPAGFDLEHPLGFVEDDGTAWQLRPTRSPFTDSWIELSCLTSHVLIDGESFRVGGGCIVLEDDTVYLPTLDFIARPLDQPHDRFTRLIQNQAKKRVEAALNSDQAKQLFAMAREYTMLPIDERLRVSALTEIALASQDELENMIADEEKRLAPGGHEDQIADRLAAEIAAINPNAPRKRRRVAAKIEELQRRSYYKACGYERIALCREGIAILDSAI